MAPALTGLSLGAARVEIVPPTGSMLSGFIARTTPMTGSHDSLFARAIVWAGDDTASAGAALVTLDVLDLNAESVAAIRQRAATLTGIPAEQIAVTCTHTHGAPVAMPGRFLGRCDPVFLSRLIDVAADAIAAATQRREQVVLSFGLGTEPTVGKNRRVPAGVTDPDLPVLRFQRPDGTVAALLVSYACHPVTLGPSNLLTTADYPGYVVRTLETVYPGAMALFATGCCGQINTGHTSRTSLLGLGSEWRAYGEAERLGRVVAGGAIVAAERAARDDAALPITKRSIRPIQVRVARTMVPMPLLPAPVEAERQRLVATWTQHLNAAEHTGDEVAKAQYQVFLEWAAALAAGTLPAAVSAEVMVIALGAVNIVLLPGESFVEFGLAIKDRAAARPVITLAYANGCPGYIPHQSAYPAGGYEVEDAYRYYGYPACFAPEAGEGLVTAALDLLASLD